jgi:phosphate transport system permease protein
MTLEVAAFWPPQRTRWSRTKALSFGFSALLIVVLAISAVIFLWQSVPVWQHEKLDYVLGRHWFYRDAKFGAAPMIYGTMVVALIAVLLAAPIGIAAGIFIACFLPATARLAAKVTIELLAGIPSVVYGLLGILLLRDWIYELFEPFDVLSGDTLLTAGILLAVMILPTILTLTDDAACAVASAQTRAARGLGLTRVEGVLFAVIPLARMGILSAVLLALGRALGETIAVFLVVGRQDNQWPESLWSPRSWLEAGQTLTSKLGGSEVNIAYGDSVHWAAVMGLGLILLALVAAITYLGAWLGKVRSA